MEGDDIQRIDVLVQELGGRSRDEGITNAVEAVLAEAVALCDFWIDGVGVNVRRESHVKLRVETGNIDGVGEKLDAGVDNAERNAIVQGREVAQLLDVVICVLSDDLRPIVIAAMDNAMASNGYVGFGVDLGKPLVVDERLQEKVKGVILALDLVGDILPLDKRLPAASVGELSRWGSEAADLSVGDLAGQLTVLCREDGDLDRAGAGVDGEDDLHGRN